MQIFFGTMLFLLLLCLWQINKSATMDEKLHKDNKITKEQWDKNFKTKTNLFEALMFVSLLMLVLVLSV